MFVLVAVCVFFFFAPSRSAVNGRTKLRDFIVGLL